MQVKKQQLETDMKQWTGSKWGKEYVKVVYCHSTYLMDFILRGPKITADGDCSHESKRHSLLRKKAMTNLGIILKSIDFTLLTKVHLVKAMVLPVVIRGCESWTIKNAECRRIDAFKLWCWRRLFFFFLIGVILFFFFFNL